MKSRFIVITDNGVYSAYSLKLLNKKHNVHFVEDDFRRFGSDYVLYVSKDDLTYQRDLSYLSQIPMSLLYRVDKKPFLISLANFIFTLFVLLQVANTSNLVNQIAVYLSGR